MIVSFFWILLVLAAVIFPAEMPLLLGIGTVLSCAAYLFYVYIPLFFSKYSMWIGAGLLLLPVPIGIAAAVLVPQKAVIFTLLAVLSIGLAGILPPARYLCFRIRLYKLFGRDGKIGLFPFLREGRGTPLQIERETTEGKITLSVLGSIGTARYFLTEDAVVHQSVRALSAGFIAELERKEDTEFHHALLSPLTGAKTSQPYTAPSADAAYLVVHPHCTVYNGDITTECGDRIGVYTRITPKTLESMLRRIQIKE